MKSPTSIAEWGVEFEALLDAALAIFCQRWNPPSAPEKIAVDPVHNLAWRCNRKRTSLVASLGERPELVRANEALLLRVAVHDLNPSFNRYLIDSIAKATGLNGVHNAIIDYLENGTIVEKFGAVRAWYSAQPGLHYPTVHAYDEGTPSVASSVAYGDWMELWPQYKEACRRAVQSCVNPEVRDRLVEDMNAFAEIREIGTQ
ncbi:hypothetical protein ABZ806_24985 [Spirillospora sp. NPDC047418]|jgi:hypothetical protein